MKILYFMHIDWHWIKQRPHFLAEELSALPDLELLVAYPYVLRRSNMLRNETSVKLLPMLMLPFSRFNWISISNERLRNLYLRCLIHLFEPDVVWLTFPAIVSAKVIERYPGLRVVYDCMDDSPAFATGEASQLSILDREKVLLSRADLILTSSQNLFQKAVERGACPDKVKLARNAFGGKPHMPLQVEWSAPAFRFLYFGTIAEYIDFDVLIHCLRNFGGVEFHFIGPISTRYPRHERLVFHDPVEHGDLPGLMSAYDCFMMPFKLSELIRAVDPVKLYEYINFSKNILCIYYPELDRFADFVTFYRTHDDFLDEVKRLAGDNRLRYRADQRLQFLQCNTWQARAADIAEYLRFSDGMQTHGSSYAGAHE